MRKFCENVFVICVGAIIYLLLHDLHDCTFNNINKEGKRILNNKMLKFSQFCM